MRRNPGRAVFDAPLFRLPFGQVFVRSVSSTILGVLEGALDAYTSVARQRVAASSGAKGRSKLAYSAARTSKNSSRLEDTMHK